jgi:vitamin B12 transporter
MHRTLTRTQAASAVPSAPRLAAPLLAAVALLLAATEASAQVPVPQADTVRPAATPIALDTLPVLGSRISAELPLRTRGVQILDRRTLDALPARSVADALRWATGVELSARSPAQADLQLRGGTFEQVLVLVDGARMSDPQTGHFDLDLALPLESVERIEILRGPASSQYGSDAVGGVVNVVTRSRPHGASVRVEGGSFGTAMLALSGSTALPGELQVDAAVEGGRSDGHRDGTDWEQLLGSIRVTAPLAGGRVRGDLGAARRDFGAADFYAPFPSFEATRTETAALSWQPGPVARVRVEPRVTWRAHDDDFTLIRGNPAVYRNVHRSTQLGADVAVRFAIGGAGGPGSGAMVAMGGEAARHGLDSNALGDRAESRGALFAELTGRPAPGTDVSVGLRHDHHERWGGFTSPSLAVAYELASAVRVRASWGRAFRGPTWTERFYADPGHVPNPDVRPEKGSAWELGFAIEPADGIGLSVAGFTRTTRDLIDWARPAGGGDGPEVAPWIPRNVNEARFRGLEVEGDWRPTGSTRLTMGVALLSARAGGETGLESKYALRPLTEKVTLGLEQVLPGELLASVRLTRARRGGVRDLDSEARVTAGEPAFQDVDLRLTLPVPFPLAGSGARVFLDARNLLDADHPDLTGNAVPGRAFVLGIEVDRGR